MKAVHIADPCPRTPESMDSVANGFYCDDCCKVVIDFRDKSNDEILEAISARSSKRICGIFNKTQASRGPKPTFELARFAAAVLLAFGSFLFMASGSGCTTAGEPTDNRSDSQRRADSMEQAALQTKNNSMLVGDSIPHIDTGVIYTPKSGQ